MSSTSTGNDTLTLKRTTLSGFAKKKQADFPEKPSSEDFAKTLASAYLKFTQSGSQLEETDSPKSFVSLYELHSELSEQAKAYIETDLPFVYEGQPVQPLLLNFAAFRITQASRLYLMESIQEKEPEEIEAIKDKIKAYQKEYDAILHLV